MTEMLRLACYTEVPGSEDSLAPVPLEKTASRLIASNQERAQEDRSSSDGATSLLLEAKKPSTYVDYTACLNFP